MFRAISLGAGVQSSAMLLMALDGRFGDVPDLAVMADTQWELKPTAQWVRELEQIVAPFPLVTVTAGNIRKDAMAGCVPSGGGKPASRFAAMPFHLKSGGIGRRQCTSEYKIKPYRRYLRSLGVTRAETWIGFSWDERHRAKPSDVRWLPNRFPLVEARLTWEDCARYLADRGLSVHKSSCPGCPYHNDDYWRWLRDTDPEEFERVCQFDDGIRHSGRMREEQFVHWSARPLREIREFNGEAQGLLVLDVKQAFCGGVCGL